MYPITNIFNNNKNIQIKTEILLYLHNIHFLIHVTLLIIDNLIFQRSLLTKIIENNTLHFLKVFLLYKNHTPYGTLNF